MTEKPRTNGRIVTALVLIGIGLLFLLGNLGTLNIGGVFSTYWPLIIIAVGASRLFQKPAPDYGAAVFLIGLGAIFQMWRLGWVGDNLLQFWPLLIILIGVWLLIRPRGAHHEDIKGESTSHGRPKHGSDHSRSSDPNVLDIVSVFGGHDAPVDADDFRGGDITAIFSGADIDLRLARTEQKSINLNVTAIFSGIELYVPQGWTVRNRITPLFGAVDDKRRSLPKEPADDTVIVYINGSCIFGGIEISN